MKALLIILCFISQGSWAFANDSSQPGCGLNDIYWACSAEKGTSSSQRITLKAMEFQIDGEAAKNLFEFVSETVDSNSKEEGIVSVIGKNVACFEFIEEREGQTFYSYSCKMIALPNGAIEPNFTVTGNPSLGIKN